MMSCGYVSAFCYDDDAVTIRVHFADGIMVTFLVEPNNYRFGRDCMVSYRPGSAHIYLEQPSRSLKLRVLGEPKVSRYSL